MITVATTRTYSIRMGNDCTLYVYDERGRKRFESNPNDSMTDILNELLERRQECNAIEDARYYLTCDLVLALDDVEGFAGGIHPETVKRFNEMADRPSWRVLGWLL